MLTIRILTYATVRTQKIRPIAFYARQYNKIIQYSHFCDQTFTKVYHAQCTITHTHTQAVCTLVQTKRKSIHIRLLHGCRHCCRCAIVFFVLLFHRFSPSLEPSHVTFSFNYRLLMRTTATDAATASAVGTYQLRSSHIHNTNGVGMNVLIIFFSDFSESLDELRILLGSASTIRRRFFVAQTRDRFYNFHTSRSRSIACTPDFRLKIVRKDGYRSV